MEEKYWTRVGRFEIVETKEAPVKLVSTLKTVRRRFLEKDVQEITSMGDKIARKDGEELER